MSDKLHAGQIFGPDGNGAQMNTDLRSGGVFRPVVIVEDVCPICSRENCPDHPPTTRRAATSSALKLADASLADATVVAAEGAQIAREGVPYVVADIVPDIGTLGMLVAFAKVGKTTFSQHLAAAVATGSDFLGKATTQRRVLIIASEDPPQYTAWLARHLQVPTGVITFYRAPLTLNVNSLAQIAGTVRAGGYGLVLISSWQAVVRGLLRDENDNAAAVGVVETVKAITRTTRIPWLIDAHSGKGEDMGDEADPSKALRGASGAAGAADYVLSLRYAKGPFGSQRRLSGKGRFVNFAPVLLDYNIADATYTVIAAPSTTTKDAMAETTWRLICELDALTTTPQTASVIATAIGVVSRAGKVTGAGRRQVEYALRGRDGVRMITEIRRGQSTTLYARVNA